MVLKKLLMPKQLCNIHAKFLYIKNIFKSKLANYCITKSWCKNEPEKKFKVLYSAVN